MSTDAATLAAECKARGNAHFTAGRHAEAEVEFTAGIGHDPNNHVLYSNRSAARANQGNYDGALEDANKTVSLKPDWGKGYSRLGAAYAFKKMTDDAREAYLMGLEMDPENKSLKDGLAALDARPAPGGGGGGGGAGGLGGMFSDPSSLAKLAMNPKTREYISDPGFMQMLQTIQSDPSKMGMYLQDPRLLECMSVLMGVDLSAAAGPGGFPGGDGDGGDGAGEGAAPMDTTAEAASKPAPAPAREPSPEPEPEPETEEEIAAAKAKADALALKAQGNTAYQAKDFPAAVDFYTRAIETYAEDLTFFLNRAAVHLEAAGPAPKEGDDDAAELKKHAELCIADCDAAVELARSQRADYKLVARALDRKGKAMLRLDDLDGAIASFERSLTEHRNADVLTRLRDTEKLRKKRAEDAYVDPVKAEEEKLAGNQDFKSGKYPDALKRYQEALRRAPGDAKVLSNMSACYQKLGAYPEGLRFAERAIEADPNFAKAHVRKAHCHFMMKDYHKAIDAYNLGLTIDPENAELKDGLSRTVRKAAGYGGNGEKAETEEERRARAERSMQDPEIRNILQDPAMQRVLQDMGTDANAARAHMSDPVIAAKIQKLMAAGVVQMG